MRIIKSHNSLISQISKIKSKNRTIGFVPTMGALHEGHLSLLRRSRRDNDVTILSIYVNPTQFDPKKEDFSSYPRDKKSDILLAKEEKVDIIFLPSNISMYPTGYCSYITTEGLTETLCGQSRPKHFKGVTTIVGKLLNIVQPTNLYLGQKDAQQAIVISQMVKDLNFNLKVKICPTQREKDGLALSSRNQKLSSKERSQAPILYKALKSARADIKNGQLKSSVLIQKIRKSIQNNSDARIDYVQCVQFDSLKPVKQLKGKTLIALAVHFSKARLIDNIVVTVK